MSIPRGPFRLEVDEYERGDDEMPRREMKTRARTFRDAAEIYQKILENSRPELISYGRLYKGPKKVATVLSTGEIWCLNRKRLYWKGESHV